MTLKNVFCTIGKGDERRCKRIQYVKTAGIPDSECIKLALFAACEKDVALKAMMYGKLPVLQQVNPKIKELCDIEDEDEIENDSTINVVLISNDNASLSNAVEINSRDEKIVGFDVPILNATEAKHLLNDFTPAVHQFTENEENDGRMCNSNTTEATKKKISSPPNYPSTSKHYLHGPRIAYPAELAPLPPKLKKIKEEDRVYECQSEFIHLWTTHLESLTDNEPTKLDYFNYCKTIVDSFPELKGGFKNNFDIVKTQVSTAIRNRRYQAKLQLKKSTQIKKRQVMISVTAEKTQLVQQLSKQSSGIDSEKDNHEAMMALKKCSTTDDSPHVRRLLQATQTVRRLWLENEAKSIKHIVDQYPQLKCYSLIIFEFCTLKDKNEISLYDLMEKLIAKLGKYFIIDISNEEFKAEVLKKLIEKLTPYKFRKVNEPLITIQEAGTSTQALLSAEGTAPRLVLYIAAGRIAESFIVSDGARIKIPDPNVVKAVICLFAVYYVWHCNYPIAYSNVLQYLDLEIMGTSCTNNAIAKFIRDIEHKLNSLEM